ncbi:MATE family efflux transporter [Brenneria sp. g21c3]|uniref:MATE family efflux transporter n=1 Tax=Brenneria sp. g21c3 TaxID=3093893 RepID=UPI002ECF251B|nr:MATE family efflux transporter [Brenneria sp. g21c3]
MIEKLSINNDISLLALSKKLILLTVPIAFTFTFIILSETIDTIYSSQYDVTTLAAISIAKVISVLPLAIINGIVYTAVPQYTYLKQQNRSDDIFNLIIEFLTISFLLCFIISFIFIYFTPYALNLIGVDKTIIPMVQDYLIFLLPYILGMIAFNNFYYFSESYGFPVFATFTVFISLCIKGLSIYIFVFSDFIQQSWGILGFGLASVLFAWSKFLILLPIILLYKNFRIIWKTPIKRLNLSIIRMVRNTIKGIPISLSYLSEWAAVAVMGLMIARLGINEAGANGIVYSVIPLSLVIVTALSRSIAILVAQYQDQKEPLKHTILAGVILSIIFLSIICMLLLYFSPEILGFYKTNDSLLQIIYKIYPYMICVVFGLGLSHVFCFALKGFSDFFFVFIILFSTSWLLFIPLGYLLSETGYIFPAQGILGWWYALLISVFASAILSFVRLYIVVKIRPQELSPDTIKINAINN